METKIVISKDNGGWDISAFQNGIKVNKSWAINETIAQQKARIFAEFYRDDNGQSAIIKKG